MNKKEKHNMYQKRRRDKARKSGICIYCLKRESREDRMDCEKCLDRIRRSRRVPSRRKIGINLRK